MKMKAIALLGLIWVTPVFADCDLFHFRWSCNLPVKEKPQRNMSYLVYCRNTPVYVSKQAYEEVIRYQLANINMDLRTEDEFIEGPCITGRNVHVNEYNFVRETPSGQRYHGPDRNLYK